MSSSTSRVQLASHLHVYTCGGELAPPSVGGDTEVAYSITHHHHGNNYTWRLFHFQSNLMCMQPCNVFPKQATVKSHHSVLLMLCCGDSVSHLRANQIVEVVAEPGLQKQRDLDSLNSPYLYQGHPGFLLLPKLTSQLLCIYHTSNSQPQANTNNNETHMETCTGERDYTVV